MNIRLNAPERKKKLKIAITILRLLKLKEETTVHEDESEHMNIIRKERKKRTAWVQKAWRKHDTEGQFAKLTEYRDHSPHLFYDYLRMQPKEFDEIHSLVKDQIEKIHFIRKPIKSEERLALTLR